MLTILSLSKAINKNKGTKYIAYQFILVFIFAIFYWMSDRIILLFPHLAKDLNLGTIKLADNFYSYLYFSFITQSTVGFGGTLPDGGHVVTTKSNLLRFFSLCQMASIIIITGWSLI